MTVLTGAFQPGRMDVDIEHVFVPMTRDGMDWMLHELRRIENGMMTPLVTVERFGQNITESECGAAFRQWDGEVHVRYMHEMNGNWFPWAGNPDRFQRDWADFAAAMPTTVRRVWSPNISYPGSDPIIRYWPHPGSVDVISLDGYARNGETPAELFRPTMAEIADFLRGERKPVWIAETAAPRGRKQARYAEALVRFAGQQGIAAVCWFHADKGGQGRDEADWTMTKAARRAFLGKEGR